MILQDYLRLARRGAWFLLVVVASGAAVGYTYALLSAPTYLSRATVLVSAQGDATPGGLAQSSSFSVQRAPTYAGVGNTSAVLGRAASGLGDGTSVAELSRTVNVTVRTDTALIDVDARASSADGAAARANAVAAALAAEAPLLDAPETSPSVVLQTVQAGEVPVVADAPRPRNDIAAGAVVGLALGILALALWHALDDRIRTPSDVPRNRELRLLSVLPLAARRGREDQARSEELRRLCAVLTANFDGAGTITIASVNPGADGEANEVSAGLAAGLSETGSSVVVIDLTAPSRSLGAVDEARPPSPRRQVPRGRGTQADDEPGVARLAPHDLGATSAELIGTPDGQRALDHLAGEYGHRLLLCPSVLDRSEASFAASRSSVTLLVATAGSTSRSEMQRAAGALSAARAVHVGVVLVGARSDEPWSG